MTDHEERILAAVRALGTRGGDRGAVARRAYRRPTPALRSMTERTLYRLQERGLIAYEQIIGLNVLIWRAVGGAAEAGEGGGDEAR